MPWILKQGKLTRQIFNSKHCLYTFRPNSVFWQLTDWLLGKMSKLHLSYSLQLAPNQLLRLYMVQTPDHHPIQDKGGDVVGTLKVCWSLCGCSAKNRPYTQKQSDEPKKTPCSLTTIFIYLDCLLQLRKAVFVNRFWEREDRQQQLVFLPQKCYD